MTNARKIFLIKPQCCIKCIKFLRCLFKIVFTYHYTITMQKLIPTNISSFFHRTYLKWVFIYFICQRIVQFFIWECIHISHIQDLSNMDNKTRRFARLIWMRNCKVSSMWPLPFCVLTKKVSDFPKLQKW